LEKASLIESTSGVSGGYVLRKKMWAISFMDIINATEGTGALFHCNLQEDRRCLIHKIMVKAKNVMEMYLDKKL